jgi:hypothetical protein
MHMYVYVCNYLYIYMEVYDVFVDTNMPSMCKTCIDTCIHTYIHTYMHTYIHAYIHEHVRQYHNASAKRTTWVGGKPVATASTTAPPSDVSVNMHSKPKRSTYQGTQIRALKHKRSSAHAPKRERKRIPVLTTT